MAEKPEQSPAFKLGVTIALSVVGLALCVGVFFTWKHFAANKPAPTPRASAPSSSATTRPATVAPHTTPESASAATHPSVAVVPPANTGPSSAKKPTPAAPEISAHEEAPVKIDLDQASAPNPSKPDSEAFSDSSSPVSTTLAPGVIAKTGVAISNSGASPEFRAFIANAKITGVFQAENGRAFINGRIMRVGDLVDSKLGITFDSIDAERKQIIFKDRTGAIATRKY